MITTKTESLDLEWNEAAAWSEFSFYKNAACHMLPYASSRRNYIVKYFQQDVFFAKEKALWKESRELRDYVISNRIIYLDKDQASLTTSQMLAAFKIMGLHYGYSHFNPLWFNWFIQQYSVKSCYDPCGGWGHRLLGGLHLEKYLYNDFSPTTKQNVDRIIQTFGIKNTETFCNDARSFIPTDRFDAMFTCPPYYNLEEYECGGFSCRADYDQFISKLFDVFESREECQTFGIVTREDLLKRNDYAEKFQLNGQASHLIRSKAFNEYLFIFKKDNGYLRRIDNNDTKLDYTPIPIVWNADLDKEIQCFVERHPKNFIGMISSKGFKGRYADRHKCRRSTLLD